MRLTAILLLAACFEVSAGAYSQQQISLSVKNAPLEKVFKEIEKQTGYLFFYSREQMQQAAPVSLEVKNVSLEEALNQCFREQPFTYETINKTVVIKAKEVTAVLKEISGIVVDENNAPLNGANVIFKKTGRGTITDAQGRFVLKGEITQQTVLVVSFIGYSKQEITVGANSSLVIKLKVATNELDVQVVQAYGITSQRLATGNIAKVTAEEIEKQPVMNPLLALQGKVAGLEVSQINGYGSAPLKVELRGRSVAGNFPSDPLYIIDGVPLTIVDVASDAGVFSSTYDKGSTGFIQNGMGGPANGQNPLFSLNPSDIESIEVLKDADATAIYGSRAANGVVLISTKKGRSGKTKLDIHVQQGITKVTRFWDMLNTQQYLQIRREAFKQDQARYGANSSTIPDVSNAYDLLIWDTTRYTDWQRTLYGRTGRTLDAQVSLSGGDSRTSFRIGVGYNRTTNITTVGGADQRASVSFSLVHHSMNRRFTVSFSNTYSYAKSDMVSLTGSVLMPPNAPSIYDSGGNLNYAGWEPIRDQFPFAMLKQPYVSKTHFLNSNLQVNYQILKGLKLNTSFGYSNAQINQMQLFPIASLDPATPQDVLRGSAFFGDNSNKNWIIEPQLTYDAFIGPGKLNVLAGSSYQQVTTDGLFVQGGGYTNDALLKTISNALSKSASDNYGEYRYAAVFGRITYNINNKYIIKLDARRDGSSKFGPGKQYGNFGSVGAAWIFTEEGWVKEHIHWLSFGKLRGSYGTTGSDQIGDYKFLSRFSSNNVRDYNGIQPILPTQHANPNYQWQVNKKLEGAIDLGFLKDRINIEVAYYRNRCGNQLVQFPTPAFTGFTNVAANSPALVQNDGWEFVAAARIIDAKNFTWSVTFNTAINHNRLLSYPNLDKSPFVGRYKVGEALNITRLLHYTGVNPQTGLYTFEDKNKDGYISTTYGYMDDRYVYNLTPEFFGGLGMNFGYRNLQLGLFFNIKKQQGYNAIKEAATPGSIYNQPASAYNSNRWQNPGDIATVASFTTLAADPSYSDFANYSNAVLTDASFIRLSNFSLSYALPASWIKKLSMQGCNLFINANNLFVITKYKGVDPETQNFGGLPPAKILVGGISFNF